MGRAFGEIASGLIGMGAPVKGEGDIARGAEAFGLAQAGQEDIETGAEAFGFTGLGLGEDETDIDEGAEAFGISSLEFDEGDIDTGAEAFGAVIRRETAVRRKTFTGRGGRPSERSTRVPVVALPPLTPSWKKKLTTVATRATAALAKGQSIEAVNKLLWRWGMVPAPVGKLSKSQGQLAYQTVARGLRNKRLVWLKGNRMVAVRKKPPKPKVATPATRVVRPPPPPRPREDARTDTFYTYEELDWDFDLTSPASRPASDPIAVPLAKAAAKQAMAELATTGSIHSMNVRLGKQGIAPPRPGQPAKTAGQIAYKAVARGLEKKGLVRSRGGFMSRFLKKMPMLKTVEKARKAKQRIAAARLRERRRELREARPRGRMTRFLPRWLRRGMTRAG